MEWHEDDFEKEMASNINQEDEAQAQHDQNAAAEQQTYEATEAHASGGETIYREKPITETQTVQKKERKSGWKTVLLCLLCGIIGGLAAFGIGKFSDNRKAKNQDNTASHVEATPVKTDENGNIVIEHKDVTINVDGVTSPATAVAEKVLPSIVGIRVKYKTEVTSWFFGTQETEGSSEGSGIIFTEDGYIITNHHVISEAVTSSGEKAANATLEVFLYEDSATAISAEIIGYDISSDLAVLKINRTGLTAIEIGNSDEVKQGDVSIALGNPGGLEFLGSVSQGIISGLNRTIAVESSKYKDIALIQTDAAINPGNSGGALVDITGKLIGVNSVKLVSDGYEGMGFAIPSNYAVSVVNDLIKNKDAVTVYLGVEENTDYTADLLEKNGYPGGVVVKSVAADSPAEKAGIEEWDIIVEFNGEKVRTMSDLISLKQKCTPGDTVTVRVYRVGRFTGKYYNLNVTLA